MTLGLKNIWDAFNRKLSIINAIIWGIVTWDVDVLKKAKDKRVPVVLNVLLFFILLFVLFIMTYGSYRRQTDL